MFKKSVAGFVTKPSLSNSLQLTVEKMIDSNLKISAEMTKSLQKIGYYGVRAGLHYNL